MAENPLGRDTDYPQRYAPELLFPVPRQDNRRALAIDESALAFRGTDLWRGYELSWLNPVGLPRVGILEMRLPCDSPNLVESKSFKLYLNSLNQERFADEETLLACIQKDLIAVTGGAPEFSLLDVEQLSVVNRPIDGSIGLDSLAPSIEHYEPRASLLGTGAGPVVEESLHSHLFRSNCPITAQPDWGSFYIRYRGPAIDREALLAYIVSYRQHEGFHEHCVEQMFMDIVGRCEPEWLVLGIQFLRRGGLEINPWRWSLGAPVDGVPGVRTARQ